MIVYFYVRTNSYSIIINQHFYKQLYGTMSIILIENY
jgi:hypothetical protein